MMPHNLSNFFAQFQPLDLLAWPHHYYQCLLSLHLKRFIQTVKFTIPSYHLVLQGGHGQAKLIPLLHRERILPSLSVLLLSAVDLPSH